MHVLLPKQQVCKTVLERTCPLCILQTHAYTDPRIALLLDCEKHWSAPWILPEMHCKLPLHQAIRGHCPHPFSLYSHFPSAATCRGTGPLSPHAFQLPSHSGTSLKQEQRSLACPARDSILNKELECLKNAPELALSM